MQVYTPEEVAKLLKINEQTVRRYLREGKMKGAKIGHTWRITDEQLKLFLDQQTPKGEAE